MQLPGSNVLDLVVMQKSQAEYLSLSGNWPLIVGITLSLLNELLRH